jgi:hypothetical protein
MHLKCRDENVLHIASRKAAGIGHGGFIVERTGANSIDVSHPTRKNVRMLFVLRKWVLIVQ